MDYALVFKWVKALPGREAMALENLADFRTFFEKRVVDGKVTEPLILMHVNDGMMIVRGKMETIFEIIDHEDFILLCDKAMLTCEGFAFQSYFAGDAMERRLELYAKAGKELSYF